MPLGFQLRKLRTKAVLLRFVGWEVLLAALGVKFYDMPAELILDWCLGDIACRQNFEGIAKIGLNIARRQPADQAAGRARLRIKRFRFCQRIELFAFVETLNDVLGFLFGLYQNMADLIFGITVDLLGIVVSRTDFFVADGIFLRVICDKEFNLELLAYTVDGVAIFLRTINLWLLPAEAPLLQSHHALHALPVPDLLWHRL